MHKDRMKTDRKGFQVQNDNRENALDLLETNFPNSQIIPIMKQTCQLNPYDPQRKSRYYQMWCEQALVNFPLLYLASLCLYQYATHHGCKTFLFATRDCCHWIKIFRKMFPQANAHYFHCSRSVFEKATQKKNPAYMKYIQSLTFDQCHEIQQIIYVDVHGTGRRVLNFFSRNFGQVPHCFLLSATYQKYRDFPEISRKYANRFVNLVFDARGSPIEMLNYDVIGTLIGFSSEGEPIRDALEYPIKRLEPYHVCMETLIDQINEDAEREAQEIPTNKLIELIRHVYQIILNKQPTISYYIQHMSTHKQT